MNRLEKLIRIAEGLGIPDVCSVRVGIGVDGHWSIQSGVVMAYHWDDSTHGSSHWRSEPEKNPDRVAEEVEAAIKDRLRVMVVETMADRKLERLITELGSDHRLNEELANRSRCGLDDQHAKPAAVDDGPWRYDHPRGRQ